MLEFILVILVGALPAFFLWSAIHELSHYFAVKLMRKTTGGIFKIYPHFEGKSFVFASVQTAYAGETLSNKEIAVQFLAPRALDLLAVVLVPLAGLFVAPWLQALWLVVWGAGIIDLAVGSTGATAVSDLQRASHALGWSPWVLRILGWTFVIIAATITVLVFAL